MVPSWSSGLKPITVPAMLIGMLGGWEVAIILLVVLMIFGPQKLPQLGASVGKMLRGFKKELKEFTEEDRKDGAPLPKAEGREEIDVTPQEPNTATQKTNQ